MPALADNPGLAFEWRARNYVSSETTPGGFPLNREQGRLEGIALEFAASAAGGRWALRAAQEQGELSYDGFSQFGIPLSTTTDLRVRSLALRWSPGQRFHAGPVAIDGGLEVAQQRIDRAIRPGPQSQALTEILDSTWTRGLLAIEWQLHGAWSLQARVSLAWPIARRLEVDSFGTYDTFALRPRARLAEYAGLGIEWRHATALRAGLWAIHEKWRFGRSATREVTRDGAAVGTASYPGSRPRLRGLALRLETWF